MQKLRFYDDNTRSWWEAATGEEDWRWAGLHAALRYAVPWCSAATVLCQQHFTCLAAMWPCDGATRKLCFAVILAAPAGGANVPALNDLLVPYGIAFGGGVLDGNVQVWVGAAQRLCACWNLNVFRPTVVCPSSGRPLPLALQCTH